MGNFRLKVTMLAVPTLSGQKTVSFDTLMETPLSLNRGCLDVNAVLDGDFRVRGVASLRVVDASSWPNVPGYFTTTPTYMV